MPLKLRLVSDHFDIVGDDDERQFGEKGGTIGRALENDWILPDPDRFISGRHATVDYRSGAFYLADISTNGVYMNGEDEPIGNGSPRRLFDGDLVRMGDLEFAVTVDEGEDLDMPEPEPVTVVPDNIEQLVDEASLMSAIQMLDEEEITGDEEFQSALLAGPAIPAASKNAAAKKVQSPDPPPPAEPGPIATEDVFDSFLRGVGIERSDIHPSTDPAEIMENAGNVLRELVHGVSDLLIGRANVKSMFRLDQTTVLPQHSNPLKLAENSVEATKQLLLGKQGKNIDPLDAVREASLDLRFHQDALLEGMVSAFNDFADRFDPNELEESFNLTLNRKPLFAALNQLKFWQLYTEAYRIMTQPGSGLFPHHFGEDFVRSYEKQISEYKRAGRGYDGVTDRRKPTPQAAVEPGDDP